jgi:tRNA nucleotidyltransferase/poly(A) polymerase
VCAVLQENGHKAYVVGGAVRDIIVGQVPKDFDVATSATPKKSAPCSAARGSSAAASRSCM